MLPQRRGRVSSALSQEFADCTGQVASPRLRGHRRAANWLTPIGSYSRINLGDTLARQPLSPPEYQEGGSIGDPAGKHGGVGSPWQDGRAGHRLSLSPVPSQSEQGRPEAVTATAYASVDQTEARNSNLSFRVRHARAVEDVELGPAEWRPPSSPQGVA